MNLPKLIALSASFLAPMILIALGSSCSDIQWSPEKQSTKQASGQADSVQSDWEVSHYFDDYGDKTDRKFLANKVLFKGRFSNSATDGSKLTARIVVEKDKGLILLFYEYGWSDMSHIDVTEYSVYVNTSDNQEISGKIPCLSLCLFSDELTQSIHNWLMAGKNVKFYLEHERKILGSTTYRFSTGEHQGYAGAYAKL